MRKKKKRLAFAWISWALCLLLAFPALGAKTGLEDAKGKKTVLEEEKKKTEQTLKGLESLKSDTTAYVKKLDDSLETISGELSKLSDQITGRKPRLRPRKRSSRRRRKRKKPSMNP